MYIRRKVFSTYIDENGEEKLFSTTEIMSEESYLEKLYSDNEPKQKEFNSKVQKLLRTRIDAAEGVLRPGFLHPTKTHLSDLVHHGRTTVKRLPANKLSVYGATKEYLSNPNINTKINLKAAKKNKGLDPVFK